MTNINTLVNCLKHHEELFIATTGGNGKQPWVGIIIGNKDNNNMKKKKYLQEEKDKFLNILYQDRSRNSSTQTFPTALHNIY